MTTLLGTAPSMASRGRYRCRHNRGVIAALWILVCLCLAVCGLLFMALHRIRLALDAAELQVLRLSEQVVDLEQRVEELESGAVEEPPTPSLAILPAVQAFASGDKKKWIPALVLIGVQIIAAYYRRRSASAPEDKI